MQSIDPKTLTMEEKIAILRAPLPAVRTVISGLRTAGNPLGLKAVRLVDDDSIEKVIRSK